MTYNEFIQNIINTRGQWDILEGEYFEAHHIIPRCLGGEGNNRKNGVLNKHPNIIFLYAEEHYEAHKLLALENPNNIDLIWAWDAMAYKELKDRKYLVSAEDYAILKKLHVDYMSKNRIGINPETGKSYLYGTHLSEETKSKISKANKGKNRYSRTEETKQKMRLAALNRPGPCDNYTRGKKAINNGVDLIYIDKEEPLPEGYEYGLILEENRELSNYKSSWTEERRKEFSQSRSGENSPHYGIHINFGTGMKGKTHTEESKSKHRETVSNKTKEEKEIWALKQSQALLGKKKPEGFSDKCSKNTSQYIYLIDNQEIYGFRNIINYLEEKYNILTSNYYLKKYFIEGLDIKNILCGLNLRRIENENCKNKPHN